MINNKFVGFSRYRYLSLSLAQSRCCGFGKTGRDPFIMVMTYRERDFSFDVFLPIFTEHSRVRRKRKMREGFSDSLLIVSCPQWPHNLISSARFPETMSPSEKLKSGISVESVIESTERVKLLVPYFYTLDSTNNSDPVTRKLRFRSQEWCVRRFLSQIKRVLGTIEIIY